MEGMLQRPRPAACHLDRALGGAEACPGDSCLFWESAAGGGACGIEPLRLNLAQNPALAAHLLELRRQLARPGDADETARSLFFRLLNDEQHAESAEEAREARADD